jgi:molybdopterin synthase sulfur carrier subunit
VNILYFAWVREQIGMDQEQVDPPSESHATALGDASRLRAAVDQRFAQLDAPITGAREIALFPPVTGG